VLPADTSTIFATLVSWTLNYQRFSAERGRIIAKQRKVPGRYWPRHAPTSASCRQARWRSGNCFGAGPLGFAPSSNMCSPQGGGRDDAEPRSQRCGIDYADIGETVLPERIHPPRPRYVQR
jgi:hypothetical protein